MAKNFLKKYGRIIILIIVLIITTEVTFYVNRLIDSTLENQNNEVTISKLNDQIEASHAKEKGLNEKQIVWEQELIYFRDQYAEENKILWQYIPADEWKNQMNGIIDEVNTTYLSDEEILSKVKKVIPERFISTAMEDYFKSIQLLNPSLFQ